MANHLDEEHQDINRQTQGPKPRTEQVLDVVEAIFLQTVDVRGHLPVDDE